MDRKFIFLCIAFLAMLLVMFFFFFFKKTIVYVDSKKVYNEFNMTIELKNEYNKLVSVHKRYLDSLMLDYEVTQRENKNTILLEIKKDNYISTKDEFIKVEEQLNNKLTNQSWNQINQYMMDYGEKYGYDFIMGAFGNGNIMYANESKNVTDDVIEFINRKYQGN